MGVPSYFRWLAEKYGKTVVDALEDIAQEVDGVMVKPDLTQPNPNGVEFDNLYLDMNGIIHNCSHPENKPQPASEYEVMQNIFEYVDRLFSIVRPRRLYYMAIDGVAPRAKMNQQRSRRFRAAKESKDAKEAKKQAEEEALSSGRLSQAEFEALRAEATGSWHFDSNSITPGSPFMEKVAKSLRWYAYDRLTRDPAWANLQVIISDASVPGEGEHKIVDFIRKQKALPGYDANTKHVFYGLDADLIMLGLATHEPHFTILREFVAFGKRNENDRFAREGGQSEQHHPFQFLRLNVLREYLAIDLRVPNLPFEWDLERAIDDYVFLCFFVGNDFLPHMPTLEIREGAIELLIEMWKKVLPSIGGFITEHGEIDLGRAELLLKEVGKLETAILQRRAARNKRKQINDARRDKERRMEKKNFESGKYAIVDFNAVESPGHRRPASTGAIPAADNSSAASSLKDRLRGDPPTSRAPDQTPLDVTPAESPAPQPPQSSSLPSQEMEQDEPNPNAAALEPVFTGYEEGDKIQLGSDGYRERYYQSKFRIGVEKNSEDELVAGSSQLNAVTRAYMEGLVWVLRYYYQGCCSWTWYFPYHYAPFAIDVIDMPAMGPFDMELGEPFTPFEQLMGVLPAASADCLPEPYRWLMKSPTSPIVDFYPEHFELDMNGKKQAWHAIALLPFIDQQRLLDAVKPVAKQLSEAERFRNTTGHDEYIVSGHHANSTLIKQIQDSGVDRSREMRLSMPSDIDIQHVFVSENHTQIDPNQSGSICGELVFSLLSPPPGTDVTAPFAECGTTLNCNAFACLYLNPVFPPRFQFQAFLHPRVILPDKLLTEDDRKRPALFAAGAPASIILDAVMNSFHGNSGGRGGPMRGPGQRGGRDAPYGRGGGYNDRGDRGDRGGYGRGGYNDRSDRGGYNNRGGYSDRGGRGGGYSDRGGRGGYNDYGGGRGGGRGGSRYDDDRNHGRSDQGNRSGGYRNDSYDNRNYGNRQDNYQPRPGFGAPSQPTLPNVAHHQVPQQYTPPPMQHHNAYPPPQYYNQSHPGYQAPQAYVPAPQPYYAPPPQAYPPMPQAAPSGSLSASLAPMLAASAQSLGVHQNYFQPAAQGSFQTSNMNLQQLYQQQQQSRGPPRHGQY